MRVAAVVENHMKHLARMLLALSCAALAVSGIALRPGRVVAQPSTEIDASEIETEARARFQLGQLYYSQARFAEAAAEFEAAYAAHAHPVLLHNLYLARRDLGDVPGAIDALTRYLATATDLSAADRRLLEGRLQTMQRQLAATPARVPETTEDPHEPVRVGEDVIAVPVEDVVTHETQDSAPPVSPASAGGLGVAPGALVLGIGGAVLIGAAIAAGIAEGVRSERDGMCTLPEGSCPGSVDQASYASRFGAARDAGWALLVSGAVLAAVGGVLLGVGVSEPSLDRPAASAFCDDHGCVATLSGAF